MAEEKCLGKGCRWFTGKADSSCFFIGVLPNCSPSLKLSMKKELEQFNKGFYPKSEQEYIDRQG